MSNPDRTASDGDAVDFGPYLQRYLAGDRDALTALPKRERDLALTLAPSLAQHDKHHPSDIESGARPSELDPLAIALGLVPGPEDVLGSRELQAARKRAKLDLRQLLELLQQRGWDLEGQQILAWHKRNTVVPPALMSAIADTLGVPTASLRGAPETQQTSDVGAIDYLDDALIERYLRDWAADVGEDLTQLRELTQQTLASLNFRNRKEITRDDVLGILRAIRSINSDDSND